MTERRQRARVQGSWAQSRAKPRSSGPVQREPGSWAGGLQRNQDTNYQFQQPAQRLRQIPTERVIESSGVYDISVGPSGVSRLRLFHNFLSTEEADWMFSKLLHELPWSQKTNYSRGESYEEPRLTCWFGDLPYTYSHSTMKANTQWPSVLLSLRSRLNSDLGLGPGPGPDSGPGPGPDSALGLGPGPGPGLNSVLCNLYRSGRDSIAWHSDSEASLGPEPTIASVSLGDTRVLQLRKNPAPDEGGDFTYSPRVSVALSHASLLVMEGATQSDWQHQVAKEYHDRGPRINLTFRTILPEPRGPGPGARGSSTSSRLQ